MNLLVVVAIVLLHLYIAVSAYCQIVSILKNAHCTPCSLIVALRS